MVKFGLPVILRFGLMVKKSAFRFSYNSAFRIWPNSPVRSVLHDMLTAKLTFLWYDNFGEKKGLSRGMALLAFQKIGNTDSDSWLACF